MAKLLWMITYCITLICFISFILWMFTDEAKFEIIFFATFALQIFGILTKGSTKKS